MKVEEPDINGTYNYANYLSWSWEQMVELIHGKIYKMSPAPTSGHQRVSVELTRQIANFLHRKKCEVFEAPFDVRLPAPSGGHSDEEITTVVQPDICVVCDPSKIDARGCIGAPDLIIEILSESTANRDTVLKKRIYQTAGVREYWVVNVELRTVTVFRLIEGVYDNVGETYAEQDMIETAVLPGLKIVLEDVFYKLSRGG